MGIDLGMEVERFAVTWLPDSLNRFRSDLPQEQQFERAVAMLARLVFVGADAAGECRAARVDSLIARAVLGSFQVSYAMGAGATRAVMQRSAITFGHPAEECESQAESLCRYMEQWREGGDATRLILRPRWELTMATR